MNSVTARQIALVHKLYGPQTLYARLLKMYERLYKAGLCTKHSTHDALFFIHDEGAWGFKTIKFYDDGKDYRIGGFNPSQSEAYNEAIHVL